jgi:uncharacterized protein (TIGR02246 family)
MWVLRDLFVMSAATSRGDEAVFGEVDADAVRGAAREYLAAVQDGDIDAIRRSWTDDGVYVDASGKSQQVAKMLRERPVRPRSSILRKAPSSQLTSLRFVATGVAIEEGDYTCGPAQGGSEGCGHFTAVWVERDGRWRLDVIVNGWAWVMLALGLRTAPKTS